MRPFSKSVNSIVLTASLGTMFLATVPIKAVAQEHQYSSQLVDRYQVGCSNKLQQKGYSTQEAQELCACSLKQMQKHHSQSSAIVTLTSAQFSPAIDPKLGMPKKLSKYFAPCLG